MSNNFPLELMINVFSRLPVKSLRRFKRVSKEICKLIEDPYFVKAHLDQSLQSSNNNNLVLMEHGSRNLLISSGDFNSIDINGVKDDNHGPIFERLTKIIGCCNGLICLTADDFDKVIVLNVSTRKYRIIIAQDLQTFSFGFGYDSINDDYKLISIGSWVWEHKRHTKVYSLKTGRWREIGLFTMPYGTALRLARQGVFFAGSIHTLVDDPRYAIATFNLHTERFHEVEMCDEMLRDVHVTQRFDLSVLGGLLCVTHNDKIRRCANIWVMEKYNVRESWTKCFRVNLWEIWIGASCLHPLAYSKAGDKVLMHSIKDHYWFDPVKNQLSEINAIRELSKDSEISIVCPQTPVQVNYATC